MTDIDDPRLQPSKVNTRAAKIAFVEPLTPEHTARVLDALLMWSHTRSLYYAGKMGRSEYRKYKEQLLALVATKEAP